MRLEAVETWSGEHESSVEVRTSNCTYRVAFEGSVATIHAPGLSKVIELDEEFYPLEDDELCAIMLVAQVEGGISL